MSLNQPKNQPAKIKHIAFIMDGNGRWAQKRGLPREYGHRKGAEAFKKVIEYCGELGIEASEVNLENFVPEKYDKKTIGY